MRLAQKLDSFILNATRSNAPASYTTQIHHPRLPSDTLTFDFDSPPLAVDDVYIALLDSFYSAAQQLSDQSGNPKGIVKDEHFRINSAYYHLDIGSDLYADPGTFTLQHLKTVLSTLITLQQRYNLRECTFIWRTPKGQLLQGELRNPAHPAPPREVVADPHTDVLFGGSVRYTHYGEPIPFEAVAVAMLSIMREVWARMTQAGKAARELHVSNDIYAQETPFLRFEVRAAVAYTFRLDYLLNVPYAVAMYGRSFPMRAFVFVMDSAEGRKFHGRVVKRDGLSGGNWTAVS